MLDLIRARPTHVVGTSRRMVFTLHFAPLRFVSREPRIAVLSHGDPRYASRRPRAWATYDANGNLTHHGTGTHTWDVRNRLSGLVDLRSE